MSTGAVTALSFSILQEQLQVDLCHVFQHCNLSHITQTELRKPQAEVTRQMMDSQNWIYDPLVVDQVRASFLFLNY